MLPLLLACQGGRDDTGGGDSGTPPALSWTAVSEDDGQGAFLCAWGPSVDDLWVVGGQQEQGVVLRGDSTSLVPVDLPEGVPLLNWVHGTGPDDVWIGGINGTLLHWDGTAFTRSTLPEEGAVWGVYAASATEVVAVGGTSAWGGEAAFAYGLQGADWQPLALPTEVAAQANLFKVRKVGATWWLVGVKGTALSGSLDGLAQVGTGTQADLVTVSAPEAGTPLVVVGGRGTGVILTGDGGGLSVAQQTGAGLNGVQVLPDGRAVVVGERGSAGIYDPATDTLVDSGVPTLDVLHNAFSPDGQTVLAVGGNLYTSDNVFHGSIWRAELDGGSP